MGAPESAGVDLDAYLRRIGYAGDLAPRAAGPAITVSGADRRGRRAP
jgi:hypothetical protein